MKTGPREGVRPRPVWQVVVIGLAVGGWLFLALLHLDVRYGRMALPVIVSIETDEPLDPNALKLGWEFRRGDFAPPRRGYTMEGVQVWRLRQAWIASLLLAGEPADLKRITSLSVEIGEDERAVTLDTSLVDWPTWQPGPGLSMPSESLSGCILPRANA